MLFGHGEKVVEQLRCIPAGYACGALRRFPQLAAPHHPQSWSRVRVTFTFSVISFVGPIDAGHVGEEIQGKFRIVAQELSDCNRVALRNAKRALCGWTWVGTISTPRARHRGFDCRFDFFDRFHQRITTGMGQTPLFDVGSRSCSRLLGDRELALSFGVEMAQDGRFAGQVLAVDLLLQSDEGLDEGLRPRWGSRECARQPGCSDQYL